jgi:uncharacterized protein (TIGR00251 family)
MTPPEVQPNALITVWLSPGASRNEVIGLVGGAWRVRVAAPPVEGRANEMLLEFLCDRLGIKRNRLTLLKGFTSRHKTVSIAGLEAGEVAKRLMLLSR